jgi:hypothetical protein
LRLPPEQYEEINEAVEEMDIPFLTAELRKQPDRRDVGKVRGIQKEQKTIKKALRY